MSRYDIERFESPPDPDVVCAICKNVLDTPLETPCDHIFCKVCINTWLKNRSNCPLCRGSVESSEMKPAKESLQKAINRLPMTCDFKDNGCHANLTLETYAEHVRFCGFEKVKCQYAGCGEMILRSKIEEHEDTCDFRRLRCNRECWLMIPAFRLNDHDCSEELRKFESESSRLLVKLRRRKHGRRMTRLQRGPTGHGTGRYHPYEV